MKNRVFIANELCKFLNFNPEDIASTIKLGSKDKHNEDEEKVRPLKIILKFEKAKFNLSCKAKTLGVKDSKH